MHFFGATRRQEGKTINNDSLLVGENLAVIIDGAGEAGGIAKVCTEAMRQALRGGQRVPLRTMADITTRILSGRHEADFAGVEIYESLARIMVVGKACVWRYRDGWLELLSEKTRTRLGQPRVLPYFFPVVELQKLDTLIVASDGFNLSNYTMIKVVQNCILRPSEMPEKLLAAQKCSMDDVSVCCCVYR